jgi:hypothetical protein
MTTITTELAPATTEPEPAGVESAAMSSETTRLHAALLRRPSFDEVGALQATRLEYPVGQQTGRRP